MKIKMIIFKMKIAVTETNRQCLRKYKIEID